MSSDTWWVGGLRSPHDVLGGVKMLAREVDKVRAELTGAMPPIEADEAALDDAFFSLLGVPRDDLYDVVRRAWTECRERNYQALLDLRESLERLPEISDAEFMENAQASDIDNAVVGWLRTVVAAPADTFSEINTLIENCRPDQGG